MWQNAKCSLLTQKDTAFWNRFDSSTQEYSRTVHFTGYAIMKKTPSSECTHLSQVRSGHLGCTQTQTWNQTLALHAGNSSPPQWLYAKFHKNKRMSSAQFPLMLFASGSPSSSAEQMIISCPLHPVWHTSLLQAWLTLLRVAAVIFFSSSNVHLISAFNNILDFFYHPLKNTGTFTLVCYCMISKLFFFLSGHTSAAELTKL